MYNRLQTIFCLNWLSNAAAGTPGSQSELQEFVTEVVNGTLNDPEAVKLIGSWEVTWGPVVYQHNEDGKFYNNVADNTLYVAKQVETGMTTLTVAVAGTNPVSWYGWFVEDFDVRPSVAWSDALQGNFQGKQTSDRSAPRISQGTATGIDILLNKMPDTTSGALLDYLKTEVAAATPGTLEVVVTGHSLGGALSATLALYLAELQGQGGECGWDPSRKAIVSCLPSAGATPGNAQFAQHFDQVIGTRTNRVWNFLDVVPHAWELDMLNQAAHLYFPYITPNDLVMALVDVATANAVASEQDYLQINHQTPGLAGQVNLTETVEKIVPANIAIDALANLIAGTLAKKLGWSNAVKKGVTLIIEAMLKKMLENGDAPVVSDPVSNRPHPFARLKAALAAAEKTVVSVADTVVDSKIVSQLPGLLIFVGQLGYQHVAAYLQLMQVTDFTARMAAVKANPPTPRLA